MPARRHRTARLSRPAKLLVADDEGRFYDHPRLRMAGQSWNRVRPLVDRAETVAAPEGIQMVFLPGRRPVGIDPQSGRAVSVERFEAPGRSFAPHAVAAVVPPAYLRHFLPAYRTTARAPSLPLRSYTAVGFAGDTVRVAADRIDPHTHWEPRRFADPSLAERIEKLQKSFAHNRLVAQLARCAREYFCCTARNIFLGTFEGALPVAPACSAGCLGCISEPHTDSPSPQARLVEPPAVEEIVELAVFHLERARPGMVSFGQGCEGEPLTQLDRVVEAIRRIRARTDRGTIHMNTNGSRPEAVDRLTAAGLQSVRVSLLSARAQAFAAYHRGDFGIEEVETFIARAVERGMFVSLNLLAFPGFTDRPAELEATLDLIQRTGAHMVQLRNLDLDPDRFRASVTPAGGEPLGMREFVRRLTERARGLAVGSFNRFREDWVGSEEPDGVDR